MRRRNFLGYSLLLLTGCTAATQSRSPTAVSLPDKLRFSVTDALGLEGLQQEYESFRLALEEVLQTSVEFFPVEDFFMAASALQSGQVDLVWAGPSEYVAIRARTNAIPIVTLARPTYRTVVVVRGNSGIRSLTDLKGKTIDLRKLGSTSSHIGVVTLLVEAGLNPQSDVKIILSGGDSLTPLKTGEADALGRSFHRYQQALKEEGVSETEYPVIAEGATLPGDVFVLSSQLGAEVAAAIQTRMLTRSENLMAVIRASQSLTERFGDGKLTQGNDADYEVVREAYRAIGQGDFPQQ